MFGNRDIPVYLFTGFLESGKTTCIEEILNEGNFEDGLKTLLILTEEGEKELDENLLKYNKVMTVTFDDEDDLTEDKCNELVKSFKPARIVVELNGMWDVAKFINETIPENWGIVQTFTTVNCETFETYNANMKPLLMAHFAQSDLVIFNRCNEQMDRAKMRRNVKAINRMAQVLFESIDGSVESNIEQELPFDVNQDTITLEDDDFGLWYLDASEHPEKYDGKTMIYKGQVYRNSNFPKDAFVASRQAMTCCVDDIAKIGYLVFSNEAFKYKMDEWLMIKGRVRMEYSKENKSMYPVLDAISIEKAEPPKDEVVYFS